MTSSLSCCIISGRRPEAFLQSYDESHPGCLSLKNAMQKEILSFIQNGIETFYSGMDIGADIWAAEIILALKEQYPALRLIAVLPCETQANLWRKAQRERYFNILAQCDEVVYISKQNTSACSFQRARYLLDHAFQLLTVFCDKNYSETIYISRYTEKAHNISIISATPIASIK